MKVCDDGEAGKKSEDRGEPGKDAEPENHGAYLSCNQQAPFPVTCDVGDSMVHFDRNNDV